MEQLVKYKKEDMDKVANIINTLPFPTTGQNFDISFKLVTIFNILNNPIKENVKEEIKQESK